jgi:hypothetical protein
MPSPILRGASRPTIDLHAPWWSAARTIDGTPNSRALPDDEPGGRYLERWVVFAEMTERDEQIISANLNPRMMMHGMQRRAKQELVMTDMPFARLYYLLQMTREITDERGQPLALTKELLNAFNQRDTKWVEAQMGKLYQRDAIEQLEEDEEESARLLAAQEARGDADEDANGARGGGPSPDELTPEAVAVRHFRPSGEKRLSRS